MTSLIEYLESFNRKERFFLIGEALGNSKFRLSDDFRSRLSETFRVLVPSDAFVAMDYHLDWIHTSLYLAGPGVREEAVHLNTNAITSGNQEDTDLIVAFEGKDTTHLMLIEAKAETGWTNKQMTSKAKRLEKIFGTDGKKYPNAKPYFCLMSPRLPQQLNSNKWPPWMTNSEGEPIWLCLTVPEGRRKVTRCDDEGKSSAERGYFRIFKSKSKTTVTYE